MWRILIVVVAGINLFLEKSCVMHTYGSGCSMRSMTLLQIVVPGKISKNGNSESEAGRKSTRANIIQSRYLIHTIAYFVLQERGVDHHAEDGISIMLVGVRCTVG